MKNILIYKNGFYLNYNNVYSMFLILHVNFLQ